MNIIKHISLIILGSVILLLTSCNKDSSTEPNNNTVTDIDGNVYETVTIGAQIWLAENLKVTHYRNGDPIPTGYSDSEWSDLSTGAFAIYHDDPANEDTYGNLYNWYAVDDSRGVCPEGWHVPTDAEWTVLTDYLAPEGIESWGNSIAGGKLKSTGTIENGDGLWYAPNTGATNESGFTAIPGGQYNNDGYNDDNFINMSARGYHWSSTGTISYDADAWLRNLFSGNSDVSRYGDDKHFGFSVRCVGDTD
ncbi:MAG: fibrobacter succinogenes major paralogous domain-containing protein [Candidatus Marinimicrobia bacterium]|nr:fibrobacter succinogenes major paralogous domain-containing protein [Candidatus Neomarinimicrobiota bacterium]